MYLMWVQVSSDMSEAEWGIDYRASMPLSMRMHPRLAMWKSPVLLLLSVRMLGIHVPALGTPQASSGTQYIVMLSSASIIVRTLTEPMSSRACSPRWWKGRASGVSAYVLIFCDPCCSSASHNPFGKHILFSLREGSFQYTHTNCSPSHPPAVLLQYARTELTTRHEAPKILAGRLEVNFDLTTPFFPCGREIRPQMTRTREPLTSRFAL